MKQNTPRFRDETEEGDFRQNRDAAVDRLSLNNHDPALARRRIDDYIAAFGRDGTRLTANPDAEAPEISPSRLDA